MLKNPQIRPGVNSLFAGILTVGVLLVGCTPKNPTGETSAQNSSNAASPGASPTGKDASPKSSLVKVREDAVKRSQAEGPPDQLERAIAQPESLKLSQTQKSKLATIQAQSDKRLKKLRQQIQQSEVMTKELAAKSNKGELSLGDVRKQLMSTAALTQMLEAERTKDWNVALGVMTPEQRAKAQKMMKKGSH